MKLPIPVESWDKNKGAPKQKFKYLVEFSAGSVIAENYPYHNYQYLIKSVTKPKPSNDTQDASNQETRTWFGNVPDPTKRQLGVTSWSPITIKFVNQVIRNELSGSVPDEVLDYDSPFYGGVGGGFTGATNIPDLDYLFSKLAEEMDTSFNGYPSIKQLKLDGGDPDNSDPYYRKQNALLAYRRTLSISAELAFRQKSLYDQIQEAQTKGFSSGGNIYSGDKTANTVASEGGNVSGVGEAGGDAATRTCKSLDFFTVAACLCSKYFGNIVIYDLVNNNPKAGKVNADDKNKLRSSSDLIATGYWTLRNPWIKSIDFGNHDYASDELQEYSVEIAYESARYNVYQY